MTDAGPLDDGGSSSDGGTCQPVLCGSYGPGACGALADQCGGTLDCGICLSQGDASAPDAGSCIALTCANYQICGTLPDGCGSSVECTGCSTPNDDGGSICTPAVKCPLEACGPFDNGCGGFLDCTTGCGTGSDASPGDPDAASGDPDASSVDPDASSGSADASAGDPDASTGDPTGPTGDPDACVPSPCLPTTCGAQSDGCGGELLCSNGC